MLLIGITVCWVLKWTWSSSSTLIALIAIIIKCYRGILEKNGSAVDAAIATLFCEGIACAQCMGLGGGFLATIYDASTGEVRVLNARERAPAATTEDMYANVSSTVGGLAMAVPGELRGYGALNREYGRLPWRDLVKPTADLCRRGHQVNSYMARALDRYSNEIKAEPSMRYVLDIKPFIPLIL